MKPGSRKKGKIAGRSSWHSLAHRSPVQQASGTVLQRVRIGLLAVGAAMMLVIAPAQNEFAIAQQGATTSAPSSLSEPVVRALQEALNRQGISVKVDGQLSDETRAAVRKYQSQHHLPVTGEPDKATLDKLGVRLAAAAEKPTTAQAPTPPSQMPQGGMMMMNCPMMEGQMTAMMEMMKGMMQMMQQMQGQMKGMPMQPGAMPPGQMPPTGK